VSAPSEGPRRVRIGALTTLKVGGDAELWTARDESELREATAEPFYVLGAGSNLLIGDDPLPARVVRLGAPYATLSTLAGEGDAWLGAATPVPGLVRRAQRLGLSGLEGLLGVPAQLGGAVAMNAGTRFGALGDVLHEVEVMVGGTVERLPAAALRLAYRHSELPRGAVVLRVRLRLAISTPERVAAAMAHVDAARRGQPKVKSAGCAFKNPAGDSAGRLIDAAGCKGWRVGDAMVSPEHANFVVNLGRARTSDVLTLLRLVRERVEGHSGVPLELEWRAWGLPSGDPPHPGWRAAVAAAGG
jgi:UDP-N-acetylmuramate dehydrogenase